MPPLPCIMHSHRVLRMIQKEPQERKVKTFQLVIEDDLRGTLLCTYKIDYRSLALAIQVEIGKKDESFRWEFADTLNNFAVPGRTEPTGEVRKKLERACARYMINKVLEKLGSHVADDREIMKPQNLDKAIHAFNSLWYGRNPDNAMHGVFAYKVIAAEIIGPAIIPAGHSGIDRVKALSHIVCNDNVSGFADVFVGTICLVFNQNRTSVERRQILRSFVEDRISMAVQGFEGPCFLKEDAAVFLAVLCHGLLQSPTDKVSDH